MSIPTKEDIVREAEEAHRHYPQYRGRWRGPEWQFVMVRRSVRTKLGHAFERGEFTVARPCPDHPGSVTAYSLRNRADTLIDSRDVVPVADLQKFVPVRLRLERLAVRLGAKPIKEACCELALDEGNGRHARHALAALHSLPFRHGAVEDAIVEIEKLLEAA